MYVYKCKNCGNYIHLGKSCGSVCIYCGAQYDCEEEVSTYLDTLIEECEVSLSSVDKKKAVALYDTCIERFPNVSRLYWGRFLACNACSSDKQLLSHGVDFDNNSDYLLALHFGDDSEKKCYEKLANCRKMMKDSIVKELQNGKKQEIFNTGIEEMQKSTHKEIDSLYDLLVLKMQALEDAERKLRNKKADCMALVNSNQQLVNIAMEKLEKKHSEVAGQKEIETTDFKRHKIDIERDAQVIVLAGASVKELNNLNLFREYKILEEERDDKEKEVKLVMERIENVSMKMNNLLADIEKIKKKYSDAIKKAETCSFSDATSLLGNDKMIAFLSRTLQSKEV